MTSPTGVLLYGPPASGKSTITSELEHLDSRCRLFPRLKAGAGRRSEYRMTSADDLDARRARGEIIWENARYGAVYAVDRPELARMADAGEIPVVHLGQTEAVDALVGEKTVAWVVVALTCPRRVAEERIQERATGDAEARLEAWQQTAALPGADIVVDTSTCSAAEAARLVHQQVMAIGDISDVLDVP